MLLPRTRAARLYGAEEATEDYYCNYGVNPDYRLRLPDERARERRDNEPPGTGRRLGVIGVSEPENVARELDDRVLEAASGTDEGN